MTEAVKQMQDLGLIEPCEPDYGTPMILVKCPGKDPRPCVDYRKLDSATVRVFSIPNMEACIEKVSPE